MADAALIKQAQRGDAASLARLLQDHYLIVKKYLITVTLDRNLAEDLTQETMVRALRRIGQYSGRAQFSTWLIAIATNLYTDTLRRQQREQRIQRQTLLEAVPEGSSREPGAWQPMLEQLAELPRDVALPIVLKHYHGYTYEEIAAWMSLPVGTVKSRIFNGVRTLRKGLIADAE